MSKPDDIPQDVWDLATKSLRTAWKSKGNAAIGASRAILAERERCSRIAGDPWAYAPVEHASGEQLCEGVAAAIRKGGA